MPVLANHFELIGISVYGPLPLGWIHVPLTAGVTALYGKNGAGKTRLLNAMARALTGVSAPGAISFVHLKVPDPEDVYDNPWRTTFEDALRTHLVEARGSRMARITSMRDDSLNSEGGWEAARELFADFTRDIQEEEFSPATVAELVAAQLFEMRRTPESAIVNEDDWKVLSQELGEGGHFCLMPTGTTREPRWAILAAGKADSPKFGDVIRRTRVLFEAQREVGLRFRAGEPAEALSRMLVQAFDQSPWFPWEDTLPFQDAIAAGYDPNQSRLLPADRVLVDELWPEWALVPASLAGHLEALPVRTVTESLDITEADAITRNLLLRVTEGQVVAIASEEEVEFAQGLQELADALSLKSSELLARVLQGGLQLRFELGRPSSWFAGETPHWQMRDDVASPWLDLNHGSQAQVRWALFAIALATELSDPDGRPVLLLADEPESGLHGGAEAKLPGALAEIASRVDSSVIVATHSAAMLNTKSVAPVHVTRIKGRSAARVIPATVGDYDRDFAADHLGITRAEMLQLVKCFVAVEGPHDKMVFERLLGNELRRASAEIVSLGGAKAAPSLAEATLLFEYTDAAIVVVLDGIAATQVKPIWDATVARARDNRVRAARAELLALERLPGWEAKWLRDLLERAIDRGQWSRLVPATLSEPDVICYLPPGEFMAGKTWGEILREWRAFHAPKRAVDLKGWLKQTTGRPVSRGQVERALRDAVPHQDLLELAQTVLRASGVEP